MKYTLPKSYVNAGICVNIPEATLKQYRAQLGSTKAAVDKWLYENGYMEKAEYEAMTEKVKAKKPVKREFKIDQEKAEIIAYIADQLRACEDAEGEELFSNIEITNPNRMIAFSLGANNYEITLVRKKIKK